MLSARPVHVSLWVVSVRCSSRKPVVVSVASCAHCQFIMSMCLCLWVLCVHCSSQKPVASVVVSSAESESTLHPKP